MERSILHVDMDEFFAAVEKLDNPALRGRCVLVGGDARRRGVVSTASYEARAFGCRSAMPTATAVRLCPQAIVLPVRGRRYREMSDRVFEILERFTPAVEPLSIDEAFLDVTGCRRLFGDGERIARTVKDTLRGELGLIASVGVAPNKYLAKLASDLRKPDGLVVIRPDEIRATLDPLPVGRIWGIGPAAVQRLERRNVHTIGELRRLPAEEMTAAFGSTGEHFHRLAEGRDDRPVTPDSRARSISQECTFAEDLADAGALGDVLLGQVEQVARRLRRHGLKARTVTLKLRTGDFTTFTRSATRTDPTNRTDDLLAEANALLGAWLARRRAPLRLLGFGVSQLGRGGQLGLFDQPEREKRTRLDEALDAITERFGRDAVHRGKRQAPNGTSTE